MRAGTALFRDLADAGFRVVRQNKHAVWACPCGHALITTATTGDGKGSGDINCRTRMARTLKVCTENLKQRRSAAA